MKKGCLVIVAIGLVIFAIGGLMTCVGGKAVVEAAKELPSQTTSQKTVPIKKVEEKKEEKKLAVDENSEKYKSGWKAGYLVGKTDASEGRERRGLWAKQNGARFAEGTEAEKHNYIRGYWWGYNEGYEQRKKYMGR